MATSTPKLVLNGARDIPFNKLVPSAANVRKVKAGVSLEELAEDIGRRGLMQSLHVRPVLDGAGAETGLFEVTAGGRRLQALQRLVKAKRLGKTQGVPCVVQTDHGTAAEEDSLAENVQRAPLHPLDQFRAFRTLREERGMSDEEIAAAFFVSVQVVRQRLKLTTVSEKLLDLYAEDAISLEQLMAFTITADHARQEQVWEAVQRGYNKEPYLIRRMLTEGKVSASDRRAVFVGAEAYQAAGGTIARDLFCQDHGGWFEDVALLERLVDEKLQAAAGEVMAEGWRWTETARDFPYNHTYGLRRVFPTIEPLSEEDQARLDALREELEQIELAHAETGEDLPEEVDQRLSELEAAIEALEHRPGTFAPEDVARAGAYVSLGYDGRVRIERGYVRPEDEPPAEAGAGSDSEGGDTALDGAAPRATVTSVDGEPVRAPQASPSDEDDSEPGRPLSGAARHRVDGAQDPRLARGAGERSGRGLRRRSARAGAAGVLWPAELRSGLVPGDRGQVVGALGRGERIDSWQHVGRAGARAHARGLGHTAAEETRRALALASGLRCGHPFVAVRLLRRADHQRHAPTLRSAPLGHGARDQLAEALSLDMSAQWSATQDNYLGRVTKSQILDAVREAKGSAAARMIEHLKKSDMAQEAERLLAGTGWLPALLRTPGVNDEAAESACEDDSGEEDPLSEPASELPVFLAEDGGAADVYSVAAE